MAEQAPDAAVMRAHSQVEAELRQVLAHPSIDPNLDLDRLAAHTLASLAWERGRISEKTLRAIDGMGTLRNLVAHGRQKDLTAEQAIEYLALADGTMFAIRMDAAKTIEGGNGS